MTNVHTESMTTKSTADQIERAHRMALNIRQRYGMSRLELGLMLDTIKEQELWRGKASSFWEYVDDLRINRSGARSYMLVARKFIVDLQVSQIVLMQLADCNMSVLELAASVINDENVEDVLGAVLALHQRDAVMALHEISGSDKTRGPANEVNRLISRFTQLPDDLRVDFLNKLRPNKPRSQGQLHHSSFPN